MRKSESFKRIIVLLFDFLGICMYAAVFAWAWFAVYYPFLHNYKPGKTGVTGMGITYVFMGHVFILVVYFLLLFFFLNTYGGLRIGYLKPIDVFLSQIFALLLGNFFMFLIMTIIRATYEILPIVPLLGVWIVQMAISFLWAFITNVIYMRIFPPRRLLLVNGEYAADDIISKFDTRKDKYTIVKKINISEGIDKVYEECLGDYDGVIIWDVPSQYRNGLVKYCYGRNIRIYVMPKITDVLLKGSSQLHVFDTPVLLLREYSIKIEQRFIKRLLDILISLLLIIITSPLMLIAAIVTKLYDGGPILYKQVRCTKDRREFKIMKFRSMSVDAEKDGVARLAAKNDSRITPFGKFIRACRIDELPQLFNILIGDMSFIGPRPERPEIIDQYMEEMPEFAFRTKVKAGLTGYAQVYGKYNTTPYDKLKLDLTYIENYSLWLDLKIALLTPKILITPDATEGIEDDQITAKKNS
ncbi:exopolysaccharide biosynthesis polyprenyl glycosylphosphotransferase [Butyrivibrio sp. INlla21]|uniref:exopolysaccharide biosynthesis polyprenyl glycosylphosphotransferase n=1 Tax=Butyrivibrio sp. INlla21 TaxID=1520811 RepID=UPI000B85C9B1|nr:exopolysaccharide biosynthesis polyprenyl glycosylphosphotransferase [Butyrivibrio sp. INlla21]